MRRPKWTVSLLLLAGLYGTGCRHKAPSTVSLPAPPSVSEPSQQPTPAPEPSVQRPVPPKTVAPVPEKPAAEKPAPAPAPPPTRAPATAPAEPLRLERIFTPEQERQMNAAVDQNLASAEANLRVIATRKLSKEQEGIVAQVQSFIRQARDARKTDLPAASSLAQRASILAKDLAGKLR